MRKIKVPLNFTARPHQKEAHIKRRRFSVLVWHRRSGKTVFAVVELLLAAMACKLGAARFGYVAPFYRQAKAIAWEYLRRFSAAIPGVRVNESELSVTMPNGSTVRLFGADNPDALRGLYFDGIVLDEVADMKPHVWGEIIRPALADREGWALFIGTPKGQNLFSELYFRALHEPDWYADMRRASDTGAINAEELERAKREMSDAQYAQEFDCDFGASVGNALVTLELAREAAGRRLLRSQFHYAPVVVGVDVARFGDDRSCIVIRQGLACMGIEVFRGLNTMELSAKVMDVAAKWKPDAVFVDVVGVGAGVVDRLRQLACPGVLPVNAGAKPASERFRNLRAEMWAEMANWLRDGGAIPNDEALIADLCGPQFSFDSANRLVLESKDDMRARGLASPDAGDALAMTFASPVHKREFLPGVDAQSVGKLQTDYDVLG